MAPGPDRKGSSAARVVPKYLSDRFRRVAPEYDAVHEHGAARRGTEASALSISAGLAALTSGFLLAWHHPLWPTTATVLFALWTIVAARWRWLWLLVLPAALPALNLSPWTGWLIFDESDLVVLGALAGGFAGHFCKLAEPPNLPSPWRISTAARASAALALAFAGLSALSLARGLSEADALSFHWFDGYADALNSVRVSKSLVYAVALWPLLKAEFQRSSARAIGRLALGMQIGLTFVGLAVLFERAAYPGLLDFSTGYRTTATFWEMHVGGGAIDAYLALAAPFAAWALWSARSRRSWMAAALLALLTAHAGLTTFSRGAYVGMAVPLVLLGAAWWLRRLRIEPHAAARAALASTALAAAAAAVLIASFVVMSFAGTALALLSSLILVWAIGWCTRSLPWRRAAAMALTLALMTEAVAVIGGGSFMRSRVDATGSDLGARLAHWRHGIELLRGFDDWLVGIGAGRLPARYSREVPGGDFSGALMLAATDSGRQVARLSGPSSEPDLAGLFALTQRVPLRPGPTHQVTLRIRVTEPTDLALDVCDQHLLYARECQGSTLHVLPMEAEWQSLRSTLQGPDLTTGSWYAPRQAVFSITVRDAARSADISAVSLRAPDGREILQNRDFSAGLAHWFPVAEGHFLPWHIDNLYLELLIERGVLGLATFVLLLAFALRNLKILLDDGLTFAPFLAASLLGALLVGAVSSILDVPRVAFLMVLLLEVSLQLRARDRQVE